LRGREQIRDRLTEVGPEAAGISVVTLAELRYSAACSSQPEANQRTVDDFVGGCAVLGIDPEIARIFGDVKAELRRRGALIEDFDLLIAATARARGLTLVTNNTEHFGRVPDLRIESWT